MSGSKLFQAKGTVHAKAQQHKRPQCVCKVEKDLVLWKPRIIGRELPEEKLELWAHYTEKGVAWATVGIGALQGLGWGNV